MTLQAKYEEENPYRQRVDTNNSKQVFDTRGSSGNNPEKLARMLIAWDTICSIMGWTNKNEYPLANLSDIVAQYQGSVDAKYHNDFKDIQIALEIERRRSERKGISILQS